MSNFENFAAVREACAEMLLTTSEQAMVLRRVGELHRDGELLGRAFNRAIEELFAPSIPRFNV